MSKKSHLYKFGYIHTSYQINGIGCDPYMYYIYNIENSHSTIRIAINMRVYVYPVSSLSNVDNVDGNSTRYHTQYFTFCCIFKIWYVRYARSSKLEEREKHEPNIFDCW